MTKTQKTSSEQNKGTLLTSSASVWESIQSDLLDYILQKLLKLDEYIRFGAVCKHWQSVALNQQQRRLKSCHIQPPLMLLTVEQHSGLTLYSTTQDKSYKFPLKLNNVPKHNDIWYCESSHGWLAYAQGDLAAITLLNPFTGQTITLPPVPALTNPLLQSTDSYYIKKIVLSANPSSFPDDYQVLIIYNERVYNANTMLAHFRPEEGAWSVIDSGTTIRFIHGICYKGQFLVCGGTSVGFSVFSVDVGGRRMNQLMYNSQIVFQHEHISTYLVESSKGDLLMVRRFQLLDIERCLIVMVEKLVYCGEELKGIQIESIGSDALFLDRNQSISVSTLDFPECLPNSIHFTDGMFSLESTQMHWFDSLEPVVSGIWISPTLCVGTQLLPSKEGAKETQPETSARLRRQMEKVNEMIRDMDNPPWQIFAPISY